ncbi:MAG TPA: nuclear transport factor 2 family protein [Polyangiaceae bacterium]
MRAFACAMVLGLLVGCAGEDEQQTVQAPPPPPPPPTVVEAPPPPPPPAPPPAKPTMAEMQQAALRSIVANMNDAAKLTMLYAPDASVVMPGFPEARGRDAIQKANQEWLDKVSNLTTAPVRTWSKGNVFVVEFVTTGVDKASGKPFGVDGLDILTFNDDGLVTQDHTYVDVVTMLKQTGAYKGQTPGRPVATPLAGPPETHVARGDATEDANVANVKANNSAWMRLDAKASLAFVSDELVAVDFTSPDTHDKKWIADDWAAGKRALKDPSWKDWNLLGVEDFTIDEGEVSFTQTGDYVHGKVRIPSKKKTLTLHGAEVDQWKDGKIVRSWNWSNEMEFDVQLGIGPAAAPPPARKK